jgi:hypothetical protein
MIIKDPKMLNEVQDIVFANKSYWPMEDGTTFCNLATHEVLRRLNYEGLKDMTADQMHEFISMSKEWLIKPMSDAQSLANEGVILLAILPSHKLGQSHGHVATLTTGQGDFSGKWNCRTPFCMNLGRTGTCFRARGINWAFQVVPEIYALVSTL